MEICCFCFTVRVGTLILGILGIIGSFCNFVYSINGYVQAKAEHDPAKQKNTEVYQGIFIGLMVGASVGLVINSLLIIGVEKKNRCLMLPWIILSFIGCVLMTLAAFLCLIAIFTGGHGAGARFVQFIIAVLYCALLWHFTLCVWSHYKEIGDKQARITAGLPDTHAVDNNMMVCKDTVVPV